MKYTYVKQRHGKTEETKIKFVSDSEERSTHMETEITADAGATPDFIDAMKALKPHFLEILDLPESYGTDLEVHTLSFQHRDDRWSVVISGSKKVAGAKSPFNPSTPRLAQPKETDGYGKVGIVSRELEEKILAVIAQADAFRKGERAQQELELDPNQNGKTGRGKNADLTPIEEEVERQAKAFRPGEIPSEEEEERPADADPGEKDPEDTTDAEPVATTPFDDDEDDALPWERCGYPGCTLEDGHDGAHELEPTPEATEEEEPAETPLAGLDINPSLYATLKHHGITTLEQLRARRDELPSLKGIGDTSVRVADKLLEAHPAESVEEEAESDAAMPV